MIGLIINFIVYIDIVFVCCFGGLMLSIVVWDSGLMNVVVMF